MPISSERPSIGSELEKIYGQNVKAVSSLKCFPNAIHALFHIYQQTDGKVFPRIWRMVIPEINDSHAYLQVDNQIYNRGITWPDHKYPDYTLAEIQQKGLDVTTTALIETSLEWKKRNEKPDMGFRNAIELLGYTNSELVIETLDKMISQSANNDRNKSS